MPRILILLAFLGLGASEAKAWDLGASYGLETVTLGELVRKTPPNADNSPAFKLNMGVIHYDLIDYSGQLAAAITNANRMMAADAGARMDAQADAEKQLREGAVVATGHGSRTWELAQPVEGRTLLSVGLGNSTDGTFEDGGITGNITKASVLEIDYIRNAAGEELDSIPGLSWGLDVGITLKSYDVTYTQSTATAATTVNRAMMGMPLVLTFAHGLGLEGLQGEVYVDGDILAGIGYFMKVSGLAYGYGARVGYRAFNFVNLSAGYDMRAYTKSSVDKNDDNSLRIEGPQSIGTIRVGATLDLDYILENYFTKVE